MQQIGPENLLRLLSQMVEEAMRRAEAQVAPGGIMSIDAYYERVRREVRFGWQHLRDKIKQVADLGDDLLIVVAQAIAKPDDHDLLEVISDLLEDRALALGKGNLTRIMPQDGEIVVIRFPIPDTAQLRHQLEQEMELLAASVERHAKKMGRRIFALVIPEQVEMTAGTAAGRRLQSAGYVKVQDVEAGQQAVYAKMAALQEENAALKEELQQVYKRLALHHAGLPLRPDEMMARPAPRLPKFIFGPKTPEEETDQMLIQAGKAGMVTPEQVIEGLGGKVIDPGPEGG